MKVKNDHRTEFSNLSIWKEDAWKKKIGIRTRDLRDTGAMLYQLSYKATHILGERSINWVHIFPWGVEWCEKYMKYENSLG